MTTDRGPAASGARLLGDDYQHLLTWMYAAQLLHADPDVVRIELEKHGAGNVDDLVVHRRAGMPEYHQVKFSTRPAGDPLTGAWFVDKGAAAKSPLQRFRDSWLALTADGVPPSMVLHTNRLPAAGDPVLACLAGDRPLLVPKLRRVRATSKAGKARTAWAAHLEMGEDELLDLLGALQIRAGRVSLSELQDHCSWIMDAVGLLVSRTAIDAGMLAARRWIEDGVREVVVETVGRLVDEHSLRAPHRRATVLIQAIDHDPLPELADIALDWVACFKGDHPGVRRMTTSPELWDQRFAPDLRDAEHQVRAAGLSDVRLAGAFRLTTGVYAGATFSDTLGYRLAIGGRSGDGAWAGDVTTEGSRRPIALESIETALDRGDHVAVGLSVSADVTDDVLAHLQHDGMPVGRFVNLRVPEPSRQALSNPDEMRAWATAAADALRALARDAPPLVHVFIAAPRPAAVLLGHQWNRMPAVQLWEELHAGRYLPSFRLA